MKKILNIVVLLFLGTVVTAQNKVNTKGYEVCDYNNIIKSYSNCKYDPTFESEFVFNDLEKSFSHFTSEMQSTYSIDSTFTELGKDIYYTTSDVGNRYLFIFDYEEEKVIYIYPVDGSYVITTKIN
tara:strand:+ start:1150 stop:1527 length:378 start_codon:yes stop_codon:yes gene_type:complete